MRYIFFIFLLFSSLYAHKINLFVTTKDDTIDIYSYFANGKPCKNCRVTIKNENKIVLDDTLNENGEYFYKTSHKTIEVTIDAGEGHIAKQSIEVKSIKHEDIKKHKEKEETKDYLKAILGLFLIFIIFFILKRFKK